MCFDELWDEVLERDSEEGAEPDDSFRDALDDLSDEEVDQLWLEEAIGGFADIS